MRKLIAVGLGVVAFAGVAQMKFGGTTVQVAPYDIAGDTLYDTPTGALDVGFYYIDGKGNNIAHLASSIGTTTIKNGLYPVKDTTGLTLAHDVGTQYFFRDVTGKVIGTSTDQTISTKVKMANQPLPTIGVTQ